METIGARVINELYTSHLFSLALSLHGGTESFTYPYGTPNHIISNNIPKIPMNYDINKGKALNPKLSTKLNTNKNPNPNPNKLHNNLKQNLHKNLKDLRNGLYDMIKGKSTEPPDANMLKGK
jgi:hypothetical protein